MKRMFYLLLAAVLLFGLAGCSGPAQPGNDEDGRRVTQGETGSGPTNDQGRDIKVIPRERGQEITVTGIEELHHGRALDISPDGQTLLFSWDGDRTIRDSGGEIRPPAALYVMNLHDQTMEKLSESQLNQGFARYSPQGQHIAFMENEGEVFFAYVLDKGTGVKTELKSNRESNLLPAPPLSWTPDGSQIALARWYTSKGQIMIFDTKGNEQKVITGEKMTVPYFVDDETLLLVKGGSLVALDLTADRPTPQHITEAIGFAVSPNRQRLAYFSEPDAEGRVTIKAAALDSNWEAGLALAEVKVSWGHRFTWSPDSQYLLYTDAGSIWLLDPETKQKKELASGMEYFLDLHWPGEDEIIFSAVPVDAGDDKVRIYRIKLA